MYAVYITRNFFQFKGSRVVMKVHLGNGNYLAKKECKNNVSCTDDIIMLIIIIIFFDRRSIYKSRLSCNTANLVARTFSVHDQHGVAFSSLAVFSVLLHSN